MTVTGAVYAAEPAAGEVSSVVQSIVAQSRIADCYSWCGDVGPGRDALRIPSIY